MNDGLRAAAQTLVVDAATVRVVAALRQAAIDPILLKGPSFAAWLYEDAAPRRYVDTDLLIPSAEAANASQVLSALGYVAVTEMPDQAPHSTTWHPTAGGVDVDLHTRLPLTDESVNTLGPLQQHTSSFRLGNTVLKVLDDPAKALHVVIHALQDSFVSVGPNNDLLRALTIAPDAVWAEAAHLADQLGAADAFAVGLSAFPGGQALCRRIDVAPSPSPRRIVRLLAEGSVGSGAGALAHLSILESRRVRLGFVVRKVIPPGSYVRAMYADGGADRSSALTSYIRYWCRLLRKTPGAVRVWYAAGRH